MTTAVFDVELRSAGLRVTATRLAVLEAVSRRPHSDVEHVVADVRAAIGTASVQAVYDILAALTTAELVRRIEPAGHPARYERRVGDNHHHIVCRGCGALEDVDCATGPSPCLVPSTDHGFTVEEAEVTYWGLCPGCREAGPT